MNEELFIIVIAAAALFLIFTVIAFRLGRLSGRYAENKDWEKNKLKDRIKRSRAVLGGQFSEQLAPYMPGFPFNPNECRFIGKPIDLLVFKGIDEGRIDEVVLVEVKSGKAKNLSKIERLLRDAVNEGRVSWQQYDVPDELVR